MGFIGPSGPGCGLSDSIAVEKRWVHPIGDIPLDQGAMVEALEVAVHAIKHADADEGQVAVVGGAGPIGLLTAAMLRPKGVKTILIEVFAATRSKAPTSGVADVVADPVAEDLAAVVAKHTDGAGADVAFDAAGGRPPVVDQL
ncbi:zinc-binding dehydrogenase [Paeniglutamicibacter antarcticus]|uniref:Alcohol dehydrogenase-like C-terminal domain-containing protein n=1 Tax=Paeniglutamicibacter antarcticus TaxID=494023 RepID=A0ABP9TID7_9MICC